MHTRFDALSVVEVQYTGQRPVAADYWRFEAYRERAYPAAGVPTTVHRLADSDMPDTTGRSEYDAGELGLAAVNGALAETMADALRAGQPVLMTGGTCGNVTGPLGALHDVMGAGARIGLVWFDAHGDFNTPAITLSGSMGGMPLACCAGLCFPAWREGSHMAATVPIDRIIHWDGRDLDPEEERLMRYLGVPRAMSISGDASDSLESLVGKLAQRVDAIYMHIDADILDPAWMPGHWTPAPGGKSLAQVAEACQHVFATGLVSVFSVVSVFPSEDEAVTATAVGSACEMVRAGLEAWSRQGRSRPVRSGI